MPEEPATHDGPDSGGTRPSADRQRSNGRTDQSQGQKGRRANHSQTRSQRRQSGGQQRRDPPAGQLRTGRATGSGHLRAWVVYITTLFGIAGVGTGVLWILLDTVGAPILEPDGVSNADSLGELIGAGLASTAFLFAVQVLVLAMLLVLSVVAVFIGAWLARYMRERNRQTFLTAGLSVTAGTAVLFSIVSVLLSVGFDSLSLNAGAVLTNTALTALFAGATAVGGVAATRGLFPGQT